MQALQELLLQPLCVCSFLQRTRRDSLPRIYGVLNQIWLKLVSRCCAIFASWAAPLLLSTRPPPTYSHPHHPLVPPCSLTLLPSPSSHLPHSHLPPLPAPPLLALHSPARPPPLSFPSFPQGEGLDEERPYRPSRKFPCG